MGDYGLSRFSFLELSHSMVQRHLFPQRLAISRKKNVVFIIGLTAKMTYAMYTKLVCYVRKHSISKILHSKIEYI